MEVASPITIEILTKQDCCLCEEAKEIVQQTISHYPARLIYIDIETDPQLFTQYKDKIPVVRINGQDSFVYKVHPITLRKKLDKILKEG